ncbi:methyltransferase family protein [Paenarthrobacter aurescens]|uniref:methyltransferase family protein n=1 Tax=Paenarthrobacter aurescens TaxID=43663 RepID=UPI0031D0FDD0
MTAWAVAERRRKTTGNFSLGHPEDLVTSGPYALSRHPMYLGWWLIHAGVALGRGSAWASATLPAGILVEHLGALWEENVLRERFGQSYADYEKVVPRYLGSPAWLMRTSFHTARRPTPAATAIDKGKAHAEGLQNPPKGTQMIAPAAKNAAT